jgi:hypothetical protein
MTWTTGDDLEEIGLCINEVIFQHVHGGTEKNHKKISG